VQTIVRHALELPAAAAAGAAGPGHLPDTVRGGALAAGSRERVGPPTAGSSARGGGRGDGGTGGPRRGGDVWAGDRRGTCRGGAASCRRRAASSRCRGDSGSRRGRTAPPASCGRGHRGCGRSRPGRSAAGPPQCDDPAERERGSGRGRSLGGPAGAGPLHGGALPHAGGLRGLHQRH
ncbi:hypothetical protein C4609_10795, partial [Streptococcus agalactiae]